ncbi:LCP family protein [Pseudonocardia sp. MH-G8]|uniref:LCP family protein n=1 Tax=Pseudonocardia sp. MH-G8 TaxID=1854588 RepID=UPI000BA0DF99|nr:LCP family protein [Pseudonocardia sp. MH-G8]OZM76686.1 LytTR family transcriptional regulator [Pseudonocardia sp. MH-G8]
MIARRTVLITVRAITALASAAALVAAGFVWSLHQRVDTAVVTSDAAIPTPRPTPVGEEFTALLVGLDARTDAHGAPLPPALLDALHAGPDEGQLHTDTIILLHVPAGADAQAVAVSIPRDSFVRIAGGRGTHKINSAYRRGMQDAEDALRAQGIEGAELDRRAREAGRRTLVATVQELTGVEVDHFAEIGMAGFVELTEALGGVPVCLNAPVRDPYSGVDLPAGPHLVSGAGALAFVRQRHGLADGDLDRIARQQAFVAGLSRRVLEAGSLSDPLRLQRLLDIGTRYVVLDRGWDLDQALTQLRRVSGEALAFHTIPTGRPDLHTPVDGIAVEIDRDAVRAFVEELLEAAPSTTRPTTATMTTAPTATAEQGDSERVTLRPTTAPTSPPITAGGVPCVD